MILIDIADQRITDVVRPPLILETSGGWTITIENELLRGTTDRLHRRWILGCRIEGSELHLQLHRRPLIVVGPDPDYEAWQVAGPGGQLIVCTPGGDLEIWSADETDPDAIRSGATLPRPH